MPARLVYSVKYQLKIGLFGVGLDAYWPQFPGLEQRLRGYTQRVQEKLEQAGGEVVNLGLIDSTGKAMEAGHQFRSADVDLIFLLVTTYALSATVLPVVRRAGVPVIVLNLSPGSNIDYESFNSMGDSRQMTGEWLAWCQPCSAPEIANLFQRAHIPFFSVTGMLDNDPVAWAEIDSWVRAAKVKHMMEHNRLGLMGHYYGGMLDVYSDLTAHLASFGGHIEILEVDELSVLAQGVSSTETQKRVSEFHEIFDVQPDCGREELERAANTSIALDQLVEKYELGSLAYYYKGSGNAANEDTMSSIILGASLLTARGIPVAGEYEVKNAQAMKIMDGFRAGGSFTEFYASDFRDDLVLMGHDGPGHIAIAEGKIKVRPLRVYHGKVGRGLSVEMSVKHGPVTLLSVAESATGRLKMIVAEGESMPGPILEIGNTNSRYRFPIGARGFIQEWSSQGPAHHCAIGIRHVANDIEKLAALLNMELVRVC
jgi:L-arabinose isomerase